jgi:hypothetical protein
MKELFGVMHRMLVKMDICMYLCHKIIEFHPLINNGTLQVDTPFRIYKIKINSASSIITQYIFLFLFISFFYQFFLIIINKISSNYISHLKCYLFVIVLKEILSINPKLYKIECFKCYPSFIQKLDTRNFLVNHRYVFLFFKNFIS